MSYPQHAVRRVKRVPAIDTEVLPGKPYYGLPFGVFNETSLPSLQSDVRSVNCMANRKDLLCDFVSVTCWRLVR